MTNDVSTQQVLEAMNALKNGDLSFRLPEAEGTEGEIARAFNTHAEQMSGLTSEVLRLAREIGTESRLGGQAEAGHLGGTWGQVFTQVNRMSADLTNQIRDLNNVVRAQNSGDHQKQVTVGAQGEMAELCQGLNTLLARSQPRSPSG